jgi:hypothetical protein
MPITIFLSIWSYRVSIFRILAELTVSLCLAIYILILSILSPCPPMLDTTIGPVLAVVSWIVASSIFVRVRCLIAARLERFGEKALLIMGFSMTCGQVIGGILMYIIVNHMNVFEEKPECVFDYSYCKNVQSF